MKSVKIPVKQYTKILLVRLWKKYPMEKMAIEPNENKNQRGDLDPGSEIGRISSNPSTKPQVD